MLHWLSINAYAASITLVYFYVHTSKNMYVYLRNVTTHLIWITRFFYSMTRTSFTGIQDVKLITNYNKYKRHHWYRSLRIACLVPPSGGGSWCTRGHEGWLPGLVEEREYGFPVVGNRSRQQRSSSGLVHPPGRCTNKSPGRPGRTDPGLIVSRNLERQHGFHSRSRTWKTMTFKLFRISNQGRNLFIINKTGNGSFR